MGSGQIKGRAASHAPRVAGHSSSDPRTSLTLSPRPLGSYNLTLPALTTGIRDRIHLLPPDKVLHLDPPSSTAPKLFLENPYPGLARPAFLEWKLESPSSRELTIDEVNRAASDRSGPPLRLGIDGALDPGTFSFSIVARDWNLHTFHRGLFLADLLHEPGVNVQFGFNPPGSFNPLAIPAGYGPAAAGVSATALNLHFQRYSKGKATDVLELALGQFGVQVDATGKLAFPFGIQAELHDVFAPRISLFVNAGGSLEPKENGKLKLEWSTPVLGLMWHWPNDD